MNVKTTALNDRPVKNRRATSYNCDLFGWPLEATPAPFPGSAPRALIQLPIDHHIQPVWRCQTHSFGIVISFRTPSADWFSPGKLVPTSGSGPSFYCEFLLTERVLRCWTGTRRIVAADVAEIDTVVRLLYLKSGDAIPCRITQRPPNAQEQASIQSERLIHSNHAIAAALSADRPQHEKPTPPALAPPEINDTLLWHVQQKIVDELDPKLKSAPSASLMFTRLCRDQVPLAELSRSHRWPPPHPQIAESGLGAILADPFSPSTGRLLR